MTIILLFIIWRLKSKALSIPLHVAEVIYRTSEACFIKVLGIVLDVVFSKPGGELLNNWKCSRQFLSFGCNQLIKLQICTATNDLLKSWCCSYTCKITFCSSRFLQKSITSSAQVPRKKEWTSLKSIAVQKAHNSRCAMYGLQKNLK